MGARIGRGAQYFSWIHIQDLARAIEYIIENKKSGIYNMTAPGYCTNREFTRILARAAKRPAYLSIPKFIFWLLYGKGATIVTGGQAVVPERLIKEGFKFYFPDIGKAIGDIVN
jgi:NAD dependent epimerase/dehydratase family enzyme